MNPMLKIAYDYGVKLALKELDDDELAHALHNRTQFGSPFKALAGAGLGAFGGAGLGAAAGAGLGTLANKLRDKSMFGMSDKEVLVASGLLGGLLGGGIGLSVGGNMGLMHGQDSRYAKHLPQVRDKLVEFNQDLFETTDPTFYDMANDGALMERVEDPHWYERKVTNVPDEFSESWSSPEKWRRLLELHNKYRGSRVEP